MVKRFRHFRGLALPVVSKVEPSQPKEPALSLPKGFSLGELLVVIVIVTLLAIAILMGYQNQVAKANDAKRKEDFSKFKVALEDYYNDNNCYPAAVSMNTTWACEGNGFSPYMEKFLCDPIIKSHYYYIEGPDGNSDPCSGYRLYAKLQNKGDPDIVSAGCSWTLGCGKDAPLSQYNYGIVMGGSLTAADFVPNPTSTPTNTPSPKPVQGPWGCNTSGACNASYGQASLDSGRCSILFTTRIACINSGCPSAIRCKW